MFERILTRTSGILIVTIGCCSCETVGADTFGADPNNMFEINFVTIDSPNNPNDIRYTTYSVGTVGYSFRMGKYEISEGMIDKANAQSAADGNPLNISYYGFGAGSDKPATSVSWFEAAKFVNWLNTSTGSPPAYNIGPNMEHQLWHPDEVGYNPNNPLRNSKAKYFLPSEDEWYKAAYYDPNTGVYYDYPTGSNTIPDGIDYIGDPNFEAVIYDFAIIGGPGPHDITDVGVLNSYGTAGQGGNVSEWVEGSNFYQSYPPAVRGGWRHTGSKGMLWGARLFLGPRHESNTIGFRVVSIPEPNAAALFAACSLIGLVRRDSVGCLRQHLRS